MTAAAGTTRREHDSLGALDLPSDVYWGIHTARALSNFPISTATIGDHRVLVAALADVKQASARANRDLGSLDDAIAAEIDAACDRVRSGELDAQFVVDAVQGGAGTSTNMNANEVIANAALERLGRPFGDYAGVHPIDHVNRSQSTNDVYPTAIRLAMVAGVRSLIEEHRLLAASLRRKGHEFREVLKVGRTQLQDAVPMTLGQEFSGFAHTLGEDEQRLEECVSWLLEVNLGATAIGTGIAAPDGYGARVRSHLAEITGLPVQLAPDLIEATSDAGVYMTLSGTLKRAAVKLSKICNDLRLLASGPQAGLRELFLPARQAGSSIMPGKVNPVIPEVVNQVAFSVIGADATVTAAAEAGQLQLNAFEPIMAHSILQSLGWLTNACRTLRLNCIDGIRANTAHLTAMAESSVGVATALTPYIGYAAAASLATAALATDAPIADLVIAAQLLPESTVRQVLSAARLTGASGHPYDE